MFCLFFSNLSLILLYLLCFQVMVDDFLETSALHTFSDISIAVAVSDKVRKMGCKSKQNSKRENVNQSHSY